RPLRFPPARALAPGPGRRARRRSAGAAFPRRRAPPPPRPILFSRPPCPGPPVPPPRPPPVHQPGRFALPQRHLDAPLGPDRIDDQRRHRRRVVRPNALADLALTRKAPSP